MCPSISVQFSNFNSYFELLVAFTFAYASLKGFKDYINRVSLRAYDSFYSQKLQDVLAAVQVVAGPQTKRAIEEVNFNQYRDEIEKIEKICLGFYDGTFLQPMFFSCRAGVFVFPVYWRVSRATRRFDGLFDCMSCLFIYCSLLFVCPDKTSPVFETPNLSRQ